MADTFTQSFTQAFNSANKQEEAQRMQLMQMAQMMQMKKMADDMRTQQYIRDMLSEKGEEIPGQTILSNTTQQGGYRDAGASTADAIQRTTTPTTYKPTARQQAFGSGFTIPEAAIEMGRAGVPLEHIKSIVPQVKPETNNSLDSLIAHATQQYLANPTPENKKKIDMIQAVRDQVKPPKEFNIPTDVDTFLMGRPEFPDYAANPEARKKAASWFATTGGQEEYNKWWDKRKTTGPAVITYVPTSEGIVPMPTRGGGMPPTGKPIEGPSGPLGKPLPAGEASKLGDLNTLLDNVGIARKNFDPKYVGPVQGRYGAVKEKLVDLPEQQVTFYAVVRDFQDALLRARSGAQINEQEYKRLVAFLPDENLPSKNFMARLNRFEEEVKTTIANKRKALGEGGYGSGVGTGGTTNPVGTGYPTGNAPNGNAPGSNFPPTTNTIPKGARTGTWKGQPIYSTDGGNTIYHALTNKRLK